MTQAEWSSVGMATGKVSVVLVDDSTDVRTLVRMRLESSGMFDVVGEASDGEEAIALVVRHAPDLVLLDVSMPAMDGVETLPSILAVRPDTAVVMFSGFGGNDLTAELGDLGARDYIEKSIPLDHLPDRLFESMRATGPGPVEGTTAEPEPPPRGSPLDEVDVERIEQSILDEHVEGFRALFDRAAIGMATLTVHATIVRANDALARLMSCEPSDLVGVDYGRLTSGRGDLLDQHLDDLLTSDASVATFEHPIPGRPGARVRTARVTLIPIRDSAGQVLYVFAQVQDISAQRAAEVELRRSEENFRLVVSAVEDYAIFMLDTEGNVVSWNAGARRIKGYDASEIVGRNFRVFYPEEEQRDGHPERNLEVALRDGSIAEEGWRVRRDGSRFWASVVISAVHDDMGQHIGFTKITKDQTEQRQHAEDRQLAADEQARLLAVTAHELRNPTAVIDGSAHLLEMSHHDMTPREREQFFRGIRSSAERLRRLTADLSAASQLQGPGIRFERGNVSLADLVRSAVLRRTAAGQSLEVEVAVEDGTVVQADEIRLAQALDNLIDNAVRHGEPPFAVTATVRDGEAEIRVSDRGPGVPDGLVPRLFDRYATGGSAGGTGLGLYLVREIVRGHGGDVDYVAPADGEPTTFVMHFPAGAPA